jgi:putative IMPACT (imprinted ancient) family translation regulator
MTVKYQTGGFGSKGIEQVEVVKETEKTVWVRHEWNGHKSVEQVRKESNYHQFHDTWQEAKDYLIEKAAQKVDACRERLEAAIEDLRKMKELREE